MSDQDKVTAEKSTTPHKFVEQKKCERTKDGNCPYPHRTNCRECPVFLSCDPQMTVNLRLDKLNLTLQEVLQELKGISQELKNVNSRGN